MLRNSICPPSLLIHTVLLVCDAASQLHLCVHTVLSDLPMMDKLGIVAEAAKNTTSHLETLTL